MGRNVQEGTPATLTSLRDVGSEAHEVAVVVATRNRCSRLQALLGSLRAQTLAPHRFEVIVVDDASTDETPRLLATEAGRDGIALRHVRHERSAGPAVSRNDGWTATRAPLVAFIDDDCVAETGWLDAGLAAWAGDSRLFIQGATRPIAAERHLLGRTAYSYEVDGPDDDYQTCNMFYPRVLLERLGGFDAATFPRVGEDTDLGWRARALGARPVFVPEARVEHAVVQMDARGALRRCWSWGGTAPLYARHRELRRKRLYYRIFWNWFHWNAGRVLIALALPPSRSLWPVKAWLAGPWLRDRALDPISRRPAPARAAWFATADAVEMAGLLCGSVRHGTLVL
jgi:glycosyltransferase involved in cell wall biosynthesis